MQAVWKIVGNLTGFITTTDEFDCVRLQREISGDTSDQNSGLSTVAEDLKAKLWSYVEDVDQCISLIDALVQFVNTMSDDEEPIVIDDLLPSITGYSSVQQLCQMFVDLMEVEECPTASCTTEHRPHCGTDGVTYNNLCLLEAQKCNDPNLKLQNEGECLSKPDCSTACVKIFDPKCGTDGNIYGNLCELEAAACEDPSLNLRIDPENNCRGEPQCRTFVDCTGTCGGSATEDCSGTCNGKAEEDCNGDCQGTAIVNVCGYCVGGNTGRQDDFGRDKCGVCITEDHSYRLEVDCNGDCNGDAIYDACGECVGGNTGKSKDVNTPLLDCNDECNGGWEYDLCNICGPRYDGITGTGSIYRDCNGQCHEPGSGRMDNYGKNECGVCGNDVSSCAGCDGVANSKKVKDACDVCGGDGTSCVGVSGMNPVVAPSGEQLQFVVEGAGLDRQQTALQCVFQLGETRFERVGTPNGPQALTCENIVLTPGLYEFTVEAANTVLGDSTPLLLAIYNADITLTMEPTEIDLQENLETFNITFTANDVSAFAHVKDLFLRSPTAAGSLFLDTSETDVQFPGHLSEATNELIFVVDNIPSKSLKVKGFPTFGNFKLPTPQESGFDFTFWAAPPQFVTLKFHDSGESLSLKDDTLASFGEDFSRMGSGSLSVSAPDNLVLPVPSIHGNTEISCGSGTLTLSARASKGGGGRDMTYSWSVCNGPGGLTLNNPNSADITIHGTSLQADQDYGLCLTLSNFLSRGQQDNVQTEVTVRRSSEAKPEVSIVPDDVDIKNVLVSKSFSLHTSVAFTDCFTPNEINFEWSVNDHSVPLNLKTRTTASLHVPKYTLPGDTELEFTVKVSKANNVNNFVEKKITVTTKYSDLEAILNTPSEFTIGRQSGKVRLVSRSIDHDNVRQEMKYKWQCLQVTDNTPCFIKDGNGITFPRPADTLSFWELDASQMFADVSYKFSLEVSKGNRRASTSVLVHVVNGDPPKVIITTDTDSKWSAERELQLNAVIRSRAADIDVTWKTIQREGFGYLDLNNIDNELSHPFEDIYTTTIRLQEGMLSPGFTYIFNLTVCTVDQCGEAVVKVETLPTVTSCVLSIAGGNSYTELDLVTFYVDNCAADSSAFPLSYQIFRQQDTAGNKEIITEKQIDPTLNALGKPARKGTSHNNFFVKVCNSYGSCVWFDRIVDVVPREDITTEVINQLIEDLVESFKLTKNYLEALINFNIISEMDQTNNNRRRRKRSVTESTPVATAVQQLELIENTLASTILDHSDALLLIDQLPPIKIADLTFSDRSRLLQAIRQIVLVFKDEEGEPIPSRSVQIILTITGVIAEDMIPEQLMLIREINSCVVASQVTQLTLGADAVRTSSEHMTSSVQRAIPTGIFRTKAAGSGASIDFGAEIGQRFGALWSCSSGDDCSGVSIHYEHYETNVDYLSTTNEHRLNRAADIISLSLHDPDSDAELGIAGLNTPITINMTITRPQSGKVYQCRAWSNTDWISDGIDTITHTTTLVSCLSNHLTQFTVMAIDPTTVTTEQPESSTGPPAGRGRRGSDNNMFIIVGVVVALLVIIVILLVVIVLYMKKSSKNNNKVVPFRDEPEMAGQDYTKHPPPPPVSAIHVPPPVVQPSAPPRAPADVPNLEAKTSPPPCPEPAYPPPPYYSPPPADDGLPEIA